MQLRRFADPAEFLDHAEPWLLGAEAENTLMLGIARALANASPASGPHSPTYFALVERSGAPVACAMRTPPHKAGITRAENEALRLLVDDLAAVYPDLPAVLGPDAAARLFAELWSERSGGSYHAGMHQRIHEIRKVTPLLRRPPGRLRAATPEDLAGLVEWVVAFEDDVGVTVRSDPPRVLEEHQRHGGLYVWEDGGVVSMAAAGGRTPHGIRVSLVYTPPPLRGRGYASACVADLTQLMLDRGLAFCCLYTDLDNPTSNSIYQRIGYRPVCDVTDYILRTDHGA